MSSNFYLFIISFCTISLNSIGIGAAQVINQNANPLQFPTKALEVEIQGTQPLTLEQALEIARRQTRELQTAQLQVERSRAVLREVEFDMYPQLSVTTELVREQLGSNLENVQIANTALEQAREALRLNKLRFQAGVGTQTDVINAQNNLTRAEGARSRAILDYNRALAQIQRVLIKR